MRQEARRLGVAPAALPSDVVAALMLPQLDMAKWGLVPNSEVSAERYVDPSLQVVVTAAREGNWEPAAGRLEETWGDWEARVLVVRALAEVAVQDDTWLRAWQAARPDDPGHAVVQAQTLVIVAWQVRGAQRAVNTTGEQFAGFHRVLVEARSAALTAAAEAPEDPTPWSIHVNLARGLSYHHEDFAAVWDQLIARDPLHHVGHLHALQYWCAKWAGSHDLMTDFATRVAATSPRLAVLPLIAAFEHDDELWSSPSVLTALDVVQARLASEDSNTILTRNERGWVIHTLLPNKRFDEAVVQFRALGPHADGEPWSMHEKPRLWFLKSRVDACKGARQRV
ncbi:DUF4034 domain-containing protein [Actinokineospora sp. NBRC 105648]|uniref:DUF4034 domain-containing protein n=1 Tax=Actinokineospora sp. NBRC 105648 TaxID=3032206 RepID=UPI002555CED7|nr:DUF4034 domain-containing protein [Actinokineospora sp. NBRC 105648]